MNSGLELEYNFGLLVTWHRLNTFLNLLPKTWVLQVKMQKALNIGNWISIALTLSIPICI